MKRFLPCVCALVLAASAFAQKETTTVETAEQIMPTDFDLLHELWSVSDATVVPPGHVDLRFTGQWITAGAPANRGDSGDDFIITPSLYWGTCEDVEVFVNVPVWVGAGGDVPGTRLNPMNGRFESGLEGNADTYVGFLWRLSDQVDYHPATALQFTARIPTGDGSNGVDGEARLVMTNEYDGGLRSHFNLFGMSANGDNFEDTRDFQFGAAIGMDGPLCNNGDVRWVLDYINRSSTQYGNSNTNLVDAGWQWKLSDAHNIGMSVQIGLDHSDDEAPNFGAKFSYAYALTY